MTSLRCGAACYTSAPELAESLDHDQSRVWTPQELLAIALKRPPLFAPGEEYDYCNTNYALLGLIAEETESAPLAEIFQHRLFGPLGIKRILLPTSTSNVIPTHTRMATCTAIRHTPWWMRPVRRASGGGQGRDPQAQ